MEVVAEAATAREAVELAQSMSPDVVLMDLHLPDASGIDATARILRNCPAVSVLVVTMSDDEAAIVAAVRAGARGFVVKGADQDAVLEAIRSVARGDAIFGATVAARVLGRVGEKSQRTPFPQLAPRERDILRLVGEGLTNAAISERLNIAEKTVRNAVSTVSAKIGARDRNDARNLARRSGLCPGVVQAE